MSDLRNQVDKDYIYEDENGNEIKLWTLCKEEPEWAANVIVFLRKERKFLMDFLQRIANSGVHVNSAYGWIANEAGEFLERYEGCP